ncbi:MAG: carboxylating nicotinate-nucleotide diphosphorylase [Candidatus Omnitrophica bacterium]|nr:carboxylating nicotinate-nucleotide diphosphorylase [Candidatus Omnitrophota bacterium]MCF7877491.1 carboxylating nicotinate-nucleotide diphosphorylase [Candidatus Omnitrophota bacterium]MCF7878315.1 carboxylating nicotinate-nucleotide diphosphorylase [Candidatus Omnitrophota bacterium]MCF7892780.1 carboxylating nicotinate-nucleotide diphosphorylase [Candidatus Omnitrophota bacterium]
MITSKIKQIIQIALSEDKVSRDKTTHLVIPAEEKGKAAIIAKEKGILCGTEIVRFIFKKIDKETKIKFFAKDADLVHKNEKVAIISGNLQTILKAERVALNFLSLLSGVATVTRLFIDKIKKTKVVIKDTRKTTPGLRELEKYAVLVGGGKNHRCNLAEGIIIKDNHLKAVAIVSKKNKVNHKRLKAAMENLRKKTKFPIEIEVETFQEFIEVARHHPDIIMLDNFSKKNLIKAVGHRNKYFPKIELEASGGISLKNIERVSSTGVDSISIGSITHSPNALDFSLELV